MLLSRLPQRHGSNPLGPKFQRKILRSTTFSSCESRSYPLYVWWYEIFVGHPYSQIINSKFRCLYVQLLLIFLQTTSCLQELINGHTDSLSDSPMFLFWTARQTPSQGTHSEHFNLARLVSVMAILLYNVILSSTIICFFSFMSSSPIEGGCPKLLQGGDHHQIKILFNDFLTSISTPQWGVFILPSGILGQIRIEP